MDPLRLLIVEHDPARRRQLADTLRASGHAVFGVEDGAAAAAALSVEPGAALPAFDALVLDLSLPALDLARVREALAPAEPPTPDSLDAAERRQIALALAHTNGNRRQAAHLLGIARSTLLNKIRRYGLA